MVKLKEKSRDSVLDCIVSTKNGKIETLTANF
jgi:hypothetical protein